MIRYKVTKAKLHADITAMNATWFTDTATLLAGLPTPPSTTDFKPFWSKIKQIYIDLQHSKCCFCEKPLEGKIEQDVEHFRPKAEVKPWKIPAKLTAEGVVAHQPADGSSEDGYVKLAYQPFNYAMACKTCNSTLKKNLFPIEGKRLSKGTDPAAMKAEKAFFLYPLGTIDDDPEKLIGFDALSPVPRNANGHGRHRALVTIEVFRLHLRKDLLKQRAFLLRHLFLELEARTNATSAAKKAEHQTAVETITAPTSPFTSCMRCFAELYDNDRPRAEAIAKECLKFMKSTSN